MDLSLEDLIKKNKSETKKPGQGKPRKPQQQQQQPQRRVGVAQGRVGVTQGRVGVAQGRVGVAQGRVGDVRQKINQRRNIALRNQDARQKILEKKRQNITDARQLLKSKPKPEPVDFVLPQKVIKNNLYKPPPPVSVTLEYEDRPSHRPVQRQRPVVSARENRIPVHVSSRSQVQGYNRSPPVSRQHQQHMVMNRDRSRSPPRRSTAPAQPNVVQGYKISISNLHPRVTREDIYELFSSVGPVKKCVLNKPGDAEVVYLDEELVTAAVRRYDRRELDGMPMRLRVSNVGVKVSGAAAVPAVNEHAVRAALFSSDGARHNRPVNFHVSM